MSGKNFFKETATKESFSAFFIRGVEDADLTEGDGSYRFIKIQLHTPWGEPGAGSVNGSGTVAGLSHDPFRKGEQRIGHTSHYGPASV